MNADAFKSVAAAAVALDEASNEHILARYAPDFNQYDLVDWTGNFFLATADFGQHNPVESTLNFTSAHSTSLLLDNPPFPPSQATQSPTEAPLPDGNSPGSSLEHDWRVQPALTRSLESPAALAPRLEPSSDSASLVALTLYRCGPSAESREVEAASVVAPKESDLPTQKRSAHLSPADWEANRVTIKTLYIDHNLNLQDVAEIMKSQHNFRAT